MKKNETAVVRVGEGITLTRPEDHREGRPLKWYGTLGEKKTLAIWSKEPFGPGDTLRVQTLEMTTGPYLMAWSALNQEPEALLDFRVFDAKELMVLEALDGADVIDTVFVGPLAEFALRMSESFRGQRATKDTAKAWMCQWPIELSKFGTDEFMAKTEAHPGTEVGFLLLVKFGGKVRICTSTWMDDEVEKLADLVFEATPDGQLVEWGTFEEYEVEKELEARAREAEIAERTMVPIPLVEFSLRSTGMGGKSNVIVIGIDGQDVPHYKYRWGNTHGQVWYRKSDLKGTLIVRISISNAGNDNSHLHQVPAQVEITEAQIERFARDYAGHSWTFEVPGWLAQRTAEHLE